MPITNAAKAFAARAYRTVLSCRPAVGRKERNRPRTSPESSRGRRLLRRRLARISSLLVGPPGQPDHIPLQDVKSGMTTEGRGPKGPLSASSAGKRKSTPVRRSRGAEYERSPRRVSRQLERAERRRSVALQNVVKIHAMAVHWVRFVCFGGLQIKLADYPYSFALRRSGRPARLDPTFANYDDRKVFLGPQAGFGPSNRSRVTLRGLRKGLRAGAKWRCRLQHYSKLLGVPLPRRDGRAWLSRKWEPTRY